MYFVSLKLPNNNYNDNPISGCSLMQTDGWPAGYGELTGAEKNVKVLIKILAVNNGTCRPVVKILAAHTWVPFLGALSSNKRAPWARALL
jgi:hypothetical protein